MHSRAMCLFTGILRKWEAGLDFTLNVSSKFVQPFLDQVYIVMEVPKVIWFWLCAIVFNTGVFINILRLGKLT